jgi:hypothetical protein
MESTPQQSKQRHGVSIFFALAGMLVTFLAGIFVGLHPAWIPIKVTSTGGLNPAPEIQTPENTLSVPTSAPSDNRSRENPQTQP